MHFLPNAHRASRDVSEVLHRAVRIFRIRAVCNFSYPYEAKIKNGGDVRRNGREEVVHRSPQAAAPLRKRKKSSNNVDAIGSSQRSRAKHWKTWTASLTNSMQCRLSRREFSMMERITLMFWWPEAASVPKLSLRMLTDAHSIPISVD